MSAPRLTGLYAVFAAAATALLSPLLALSYFATDEGAEELKIGTVSGWADPAQDLVGGLLTWASPERVYSTYVQLFAVLFPAVFLCARAVRARRSVPAGRLERLSWRISLTGYGLLTLGLLAAFFTLLGGDPANPALDAAFMALMLPGMLIGAVGSTLLGIALLRADYAPKAHGLAPCPDIPTPARRQQHARAQQHRARPALRRLRRPRVAPVARPAVTRPEPGGGPNALTRAGH